MTDLELFNRVETIKTEIERLWLEDKRNPDCVCKGESRCAFHSQINHDLENVAKLLGGLIFGIWQTSMDENARRVIQRQYAEMIYRRTEG